LYQAQLFRFAVPVQTVAATPSDIELSSKVVFMKRGKQFGLSAQQKMDVWRRRKAGGAGLNVAKWGVGAASLATYPCEDA